MLDPLQRVSDAPELTIERSCFFIESVPPQPNHPSAAVCPCGHESRSQRLGVLHFRLFATRRLQHDGSSLLYETPTANQQQTMVKLHGVFVSLWETSACSPSSGFARSKVGTVEHSLRHSCFDEECFMEKNTISSPILWF